MAGRFAVHAAASTLLTSALLISGCSSTDDQIIDVFAASSLTDAFSALEAEYERTTPDVDIRLNLAGSNALQRQILDGADVQVFAPADIELFAPFSEGAEAPVLYATNELALVVPSAGEQRVRRPADLEDEGVLLARCASGVPCGDAADLYLAEAGLDVDRSTDEPNVRSVLTKVARGEVDAGFVYLTDAMANRDVAAIPIERPPRVSYGIMVLSDSAEAEGFAAFVASDEAWTILRDLGFARP